MPKNPPGPPSNLVVNSYSKWQNWISLGNPSSPPRPRSETRSGVDWAQRIGDGSRNALGRGTRRWAEGTRSRQRGTKCVRQKRTRRWSAREGREGRSRSVGGIYKCGFGVDRIFESVEFIFCLSRPWNDASNFCQPFSLSLRLSPLFSIEKPTGFLLFPRRVPLCAADKAPRSRPLPYPPEIFRQYPNERSTEETGWKGTRARKGCIKKGGDARHHDATADNLGRECDAINRPVSNCR